jgi:hypothetical protein
MLEPEQSPLSSQPLLSYNVWYQDLAPDAARRQRRWREFLLAEDPNEEAVRRAIGPKEATLTAAGCSRVEARPARRHARPRKPPPAQ